MKKIDNADNINLYKIGKDFIKKITDSNFSSIIVNEIEIILLENTQNKISKDH